jgi:hypothetical protein
MAFCEWRTMGVGEGCGEICGKRKWGEEGEGDLERSGIERIAFARFMWNLATDLYRGIGKVVVGFG